MCSFSQRRQQRRRLAVLYKTLSFRIHRKRSGACVWRGARPALKAKTTSSCGGTAKATGTKIEGPAQVPRTTFSCDGTAKTAGPDIEGPALVPRTISSCDGILGTTSSCVKATGMTRPATGCAPSWHVSVLRSKQVCATTNARPVWSAVSSAAAHPPPAQLSVRARKWRSDLQR